MKPEELRIGNLIYRVYDSCKSPEDFEIIEIGAINSITQTYLCKDDNIGTIEELKPIKITEEWIFSFGYYYDSGKKETGLMYTLKNNFAYGVYLEKDKYFFNYQYTNNHFLNKEIKYVHELQNLYYALTAKELKKALEKN